jgi:hypothetical protein
LGCSGSVQKITTCENMDAFHLLDAGRAMLF